MVELDDHILKAIKRRAYKKTITYSLPYDECLSTSYLGFMVARRRFDETRNIPFIPFMINVIDKTFIDEYRRESGSRKKGRVEIDYFDPEDIHTVHNAFIEEIIHLRTGIRKIMKVRNRRGVVMRDILSGGNGDNICYSRKSVITKQMRNLLKI